MANWTTLPNTAVGVGGLPSGTTVTALRDNPVSMGEKDTSVPQNLRLGHWLIANVPATTGSSINTLTVSGLNLTEYEFLIIEASGVTSSSAGALNIGGNQIGSLPTTVGAFGIFTIPLTSGRGFGRLASVGTIADYFLIDLGITNSTTSITFSIGLTQNFTGGSFRFYGVR